MSHAVTIPKLGLTMEEATLVEWHVQDGERVEKGQTLLTIETEKIMFDVEAEASGWLQRVAAVDSLLKVGDLAAHLHEAPGQHAPSASLDQAPPSAPAQAPGRDT